MEGFENIEFTRELEQHRLDDLSIHQVKVTGCTCDMSAFSVLSMTTTEHLVAHSRADTSDSIFSLHSEEFQDKEDTK